MKTQRMLSTLAVTLTMASGLYAADSTGTTPSLSVLGTVSSAELPAKAAALVAQADATSLKQTTIDVVKAAVGLNPAAAPTIVGCIAQAVPNAAPAASAEAALLVQNQVVLIARAAAAACPTNAAAIVEAMCVALPADYQIVAMAVSGVVPGAEKDILIAIETATPQLKLAIDQAMTQYQGIMPSLATVLHNVASQQMPGASPASATPILVRGPSSGAPYVPITTTPVINTPNNGGQVPNGSSTDESAASGSVAQ